MKKLSLLLLLPFFMLFACSEDNNELTQDYTSFVFYTNEDLIFSDCVVGVLLEDDTYKKIAELGDLTQNVQSKEIKIDNNISNIYLFADYFGAIKFDAVYKLQKHKKNIIEIKQGTKGIEITDKTDPKQYPQ